MNLLRRFCALFRSRSLDREMDAEMRAHLEREIEQNLARGLSPDEAHRAARRAFGGIDRIQEMERDARGVRWIEHTARDLRYATRMLRKHPGHAAVVVVTLALGIALTTNIFGALDAFLLEPLPVKQPDRLVLLLQRIPQVNFPVGFSFPDFRDLRERMRTCTDFVAYLPTPVHVSSEGGAPERTWGELVSPNAFTDLGVSAALGRTLIPADGETAAAAPAVVLGHRYWKNYFGADPAILDRRILLNGRPFTVVGVAAEGFESFQFSRIAAVFVPTSAAGQLLEGGEQALTARGNPSWRVLAHLAPGATLEQTRVELASVHRQLAADFPDEHKDASSFAVLEWRARPDPVFADALPVFLVLFSGLVALVLGIAAANATNLMLARGLTRQKEFVLRAALGAGRGRLIRQVLAESVLLALIAGLVGWQLSSAFGYFLTQLAPQGHLGVRQDFPPNWRLYAFAVGISLVVGVACGIVPAWRGSRVNLLDGLKKSGSQLTPTKHRLRNFLVVGQVTMSLVLLACGGIFLRSLRLAQSVDLGFDKENLLLVSFDLGRQGYDNERAAGFYRDLLASVRALPGMEAAGISTHVPFDYASRSRAFWPESPPEQMKDGYASSMYAASDAGFFDSMQTAVIRGRAFAVTDAASAARVAIVNEAAARLFWPDQEALGQRFRRSRDGEWIEVVGVTRTAKYLMLSEPPRPFVYFPLAQNMAREATLVVRTRRDPVGALADIRAAVAARDPHLPMVSSRTMDEHLANSVFALMPMRMGAWLAGVQGAIGLFLAVTGLFAVVSYSVGQRTAELGIRVALGATPANIIRLVMREGVRLTIIGALLGSTLGLGLSALLAKVVYGARPADPWVFGGTLLLLGASTALACWLPARRAARVDPLIALRAE